MIIVADDNPAMAHRVIVVTCQLNPTPRIAVPTHYTAEVQQLSEAGADIVIAKEFESIVQLFGKVPKRSRKYNFFIR